MEEQRLHQTQQQRQQQRLMPLQVRYGRMLEMSGPEVEDEVRQMLDDNPALREADRDDYATASGSDSDDVFTETAEEVQQADYPNEDETPFDLTASRSRSYSGGEDDAYIPELADESETLDDHLQSQLADLRLSPRQLALAQYVIGSLDQNGYLERSVRSIANDIEQTAGLSVEVDEVAQALELITRLEPAGIGARNLRECLSLQLARRHPDAATLGARTIVDNYFDLFSLKHFKQLSVVTGLDEESLKASINVIRTLNPKPGAAFNMSRQEQRRNYILPDFAVDVDGEQLTVSTLNHIPELAIDATFSADTEATLEGRSEARLFLRQKRDEAQDFIQLLRMRQTTLMRVMRAIVQLQTPFFLAQTGDRSLLRPMILRDIADITGLDLSVISRATSSKYVSTASGVYPLKMFFNERFRESTDESTDGANDVSTHAILESIRTLIAEEDKQKPLSDELLASMLHEKGYDIARRTVAKYREKLGFPVARLRRTF